MRLAASLTFASITLVAASAQAQTTNVKIGVLTDMSSLYADDNGAGSVTAVKMAVQDFNPAAHGMAVEVINADHQNKPDIGANIARQIFDAIRTLNRQDGLTVLIVEQNANHALRLAHRGYVMVNGLITLTGTGAELLQRPEIRAAYLEGGRRG